MVDHGARDHATWSASASERLWNCPGSLALNMSAPVDKESYAAAWGTACHQIAEKCLQSSKSGPDTWDDTILYLGTVEDTKSHSIEVDEEVCETAQVYVDYVRERLLEYTRETDEDATLLIEQKFSLADLDPPFDAGGTGDAVLLFPKWSLIEIVDLKGGRGVVVEVLGNKQLRTYGLGAAMANPGPWKRVKVTVVQPRAPHKDGRIRSEEFHIADLLDWTQDLMAAMNKAAEALSHGHHAGIEDIWTLSYLSAGEHCTFCRSAPTCPALENRSLEIAQTYFTPQNTLAKEPPAPETLSMAQIVRVLDHADMIQGWLNAVRAYAQDQAESGYEVKSDDSEYILTEKRGRRAWAEDDEAELVKKLSEATGEGVTEFYNEPKLMSPAQVEKFLGSKRKGEIADLWDTKSSGYNLVRADKTSRAAAVAPAQKFFQPQQET